MPHGSAQQWGFPSAIWLGNVSATANARESAGGAGGGWGSERTTESPSAAGPPSFHRFRGCDACGFQVSESES